MIIREETFDQVITDILPLLVEHYHDAPLNHKELKLDADFIRYKEMMDNKQVRIFTARDNGRLVGYSAWNIGSSPHFKGVVYAISELIFVVKDYRKGWIPYNILKNTLPKLAELGVGRISVGDGNNKSLRVFLKRLGLTKSEERYEKCL